MVIASFISFFKDLLDPSKLGHLLHSWSPWQYVVLFAIIFAETGLLIGIILPGDSLLFTAGVLSINHTLNIWVLLPLFFVAAIIGDQTGYFVGSKLGVKIFHKEDAKILKKSHVDKTHAFFEKYGPKTILFARFVPIVRTLAPTMAGTAKMTYKKFILFDLIGVAVWSIGVTLLGYFLGDAIGTKNIDKYLLPIIGVIILISFIPPFVEYMKHKKEKNKEAESKEVVDSSL